MEVWWGWWLTSRKLVLCKSLLKTDIFLWILTKLHLFQSITSRMNPVRQGGRHIGTYVPAVSLTERQEVINQLKKVGFQIHPTY